MFTVNNSGPKTLDSTTYVFYRHLMTFPIGTMGRGPATIARRTTSSKNSSNSSKKPPSNIASKSKYAIVVSTTRTTSTIRRFRGTRRRIRGSISPTFASRSRCTPKSPKDSATATTINRSRFDWLMKPNRFSIIVRFALCDRRLFPEATPVARSIERLFKRASIRLCTRTGSRWTPILRTVLGFTGVNRTVVWRGLRPR